MPETSPTNNTSNKGGRLTGFLRRLGGHEKREPQAVSTNEVGALSLAAATTPEYPYLDDSEEVAKWKAKIEAEGDQVSWVTGRNFKDRRLVAGIKQFSAVRGIDPYNYVRHSNKLSIITHDQKFNGLTVPGDMVVMPESDDNLHHTGRRRHEEHGGRLHLEYLDELGIDPNFVLYFRVTQPALNGPKPEYYWTSDLREVTQGLNAEGSGNGYPEILVSTLADISTNGGLMLDVNDDAGIAVRQNHYLAQKYRLDL